MRKVYLVLIFILFMVPEYLFSQEGDGILLRYSYPEGKKLVFKNSKSIDMAHDLGNIIIMNESTTIEQLAESENENIFSFSIEVSKIKGSSYVGRELKVGKEYNQLAGRKFIITVTDDGKVTEVVTPSLDDIKSDKEKKVIESLIDNMELDFKNALFVLPEEPVSVGHEWTTSEEDKVDYNVENLEGGYITNNEFKIKKEKKKDGFKCFEIEGKHQVSVNLLFNFGEFSMVLEGNGEMKSKQLFDYERGIMQKTEMKGTTEVQMMFIGIPEAQPAGVISEISFKRELKKIE